MEKKEWWVLLGAALVAAGICLVGFAPKTFINDSGVTIGGTIGMVLLVVGAMLLLRARHGKVLVDERVKKITNKAYAYAWNASFLLVAVLIWVDIFWPEAFTVQGVLSILLFFMAFTGIAFKWWFDRKGDA